MHAVNLIAKRRALQVSAKRVARAGSIGVLAALLVLSASTFVLLAELRHVETRAEQLNKQFSALRPVLTRYEHAQRTQERWLDFARFYLHSRQSLDMWRRWLNTLQRSLPSDAWITMMDTQALATGKLMLIDGRAYRESSVSRFVTELAAAPHAVSARTTPRLNFIRRVTQEGVEVQEFRVAIPLDQPTTTNAATPASATGVQP